MLRRIVPMIVAFVATLVLAGLLLAADVKCPIDDMSSVFTGQSRTVDGVLLYQYRCPRQHTFWVRP